MTHAVGFEPVYNEESRLLILGSFPSVKSREEAFYYGNKQNKFWRTVYGFFGEKVPDTVAEKREFLRRRKIALWDMIIECDIVGSADASIENEVVARVDLLVEKLPHLAIFCNGAKSYELLCQRFPQLIARTKKLPSTSPANPRFSPVVWENALREVFDDV